MTVAAGVDIGNSTTEIVLATSRGGRLDVIGTARAMTVGHKGSSESILAAARLVQRLASSHGVQVDRAAVAPLVPVRTDAFFGERPAPDTGPLRLLTRDAMTASGDGCGVGEAWSTREPASGRPGPLVAVVSASTPYAQAAEQVNRAHVEGATVVGVVVERDEGVLVSNRLELRVPVVDQVPVQTLRPGSLVAVEARPGGRPLRRLGDPFWLADTFGVPLGVGWAQALAAELVDASYAVVVLDHDRPATCDGAEPADHVLWSDGSCASLVDAVTRIRGTPPGGVARVIRSGSGSAVDDAFAVALDDIASTSRTRKGAVDTAGIALSLLDGSEGRLVEPAAALSEALGVPVVLATSESVVGRRGALTTPGCPADALVVDLGGGTIDISDADRHVVLAGAGELLTRTVARALGIPQGLADYAKRGPALLVESPQLLVDENGARSFADAALPGSSVRRLCVQGPAGLLPFTANLEPGEWRAWRTVAKAQVIGHNVARGLRALGPPPGVAVLLVGGAAGDDEVVAAVTEQLPRRGVVGRGEVAGSLGHRFAVAYGLAASAGEDA